MKGMKASFDEQREMQKTLNKFYIEVFFCFLKL